jgi:hypothetical protein
VKKASGEPGAAKGAKFTAKDAKGPPGDWAPCSRCARLMERKESRAILCGLAGRRDPEVWTGRYRVLAVPGQFFSVVHGRVGTLRDLQSGFAGLPLRHSDGGVQVDFYFAASGLERVVAQDPLLHALDLGARSCEIAVQDHDELVSTPAADNVARPDIWPQLLGELP